MTVIEKTDDRVRERLVALTRDLMLIPTTASRPEEMARGLQLIINHVEVFEQVKIHEYEDKGVRSIVALPVGVKKPDILLCAHLDVIDYPDPSVFGSNIEDGRIYGPGAGDMKGCLAVALEAFRYFHANHPGISLGLAITTDEEVGGASGIGFLFEKKGLRCGLALVPDGGGLTRVTTHEKGIMHLKLKCRGCFSHASRPWEGENALALLLEKFQALEKLFASMKAGDGHWHPTCTPTLIRTTNEVINRVPDYAEGAVDIRFPPPHTAKGILRQVKETVDDNVELEILIKAEPTDLKPDPLYFEVTSRVTGQKAEEVRDHGGSDARFIASRNIPVIISRPDVGNLHSAREWIDIDSMVTFYNIYEQYIRVKLL